MGRLDGIALQAVHGYMGVDFGGGDIGMAEQRLHRAEVSSPFYQMRREGVTQHMRREAAGIEARFHGEFLQQLMAAPPRQMRLCRRGEGKR